MSATREIEKIKNISSGELADFLKGPLKTELINFSKNKETIEKLAQKRAEKGEDKGAALKSIEQQLPAFERETLLLQKKIAQENSTSISVHGQEAVDLLDRVEKFFGIDMSNKIIKIINDFVKNSKIIVSDIKVEDVEIDKHNVDIVAQKKQYPSHAMLFSNRGSDSDLQSQEIASAEPKNITIAELKQLEEESDSKLDQNVEQIWFNKVLDNVINMTAVYIKLSDQYVKDKKVTDSQKQEILEDLSDKLLTLYVEMKNENSSNQARAQAASEIQSTINSTKKTIMETFKIKEEDLNERTAFGAFKAKFTKKSSVTAVFAQNYADQNNLKEMVTMLAKKYPIQESKQEPKRLSIG